ncbi:MAG TPA: LON peptidase substrate-binding domain-containing protein [Acidimicrobiales bacterium]|nr:LON peptidase substrate-binding domain-containing protein [Acidimicrobiales bacterium]
MDGDLRPLAMFPLSTVLFPGAGLGLHVFEERYRALVADCLAGDRSFGVVLIARGSEVGGGDERVAVGTLATLEVARPLPDGRWDLLARGGGRLRVRAWLGEEPYPRAEVCDLAEEAVPAGEALERAEASVRRVRALLSELGRGPGLPAGPLGSDPGELSWRLCAEAPLGPHDRQRLLEADAPARLALLVALVDAVGRDVTRLLSGG